MEALEITEKIAETEEGHEGFRSTNLRIGLLIAALAALLALLEVGGMHAFASAWHGNSHAVWHSHHSQNAHLHRRRHSLGYRNRSLTW